MMAKAYKDVRMVAAFAQQPEEKSLFSTLYSILHVHMIRLSTHRFGKGALCTGPTAQGLQRHVGSDYEVSYEGTARF